MVNMVGSPSLTIMSRNTQNRSHYNRRRKYRSNKNTSAKVDSKNDLSKAPEEPKPLLIDKKELREAALERAKSRPIRDRILAFFGWVLLLDLN